MSTNYVLGFAFRPHDVWEDGVVLIRKTKPDWQAGKLNGVGGKIEEDESPVAAMVREFEEETGHKTVGDDWTYVTRLSFGDGTQIYVYATNLPPEAIVKTTTEERVKLTALVSIPGSPEIIPNLEWLIPMAQVALEEYTGSPYVPHFCQI